MNKIRRAAVALTLSCCAAIPIFANGRAPAREPSAAAAQQAVIQLEHRWLASEHNAAALDSILADDFVHVLPGGFISKQQHIGYVRSHPQPKLLKHEFEQLRVRVYGNVAIANGIVIAIPAKSGPALRTIFTDVFAFRKGRWQAVNAQETPLSK